jgi:hypothetical protein
MPTERHCPSQILTAHKGRYVLLKFRPQQVKAGDTQMNGVALVKDSSLVTIPL